MRLCGYTAFVNFLAVGLRRFTGSEKQAAGYGYARNENQQF